VAKAASRRPDPYFIFKGGRYYEHFLAVPLHELVVFSALKDPLIRFSQVGGAARRYFLLLGSLDRGRSFRPFIFKLPAGFLLLQFFFFLKFFYFLHHGLQLELERVAQESLSDRHGARAEGLFLLGLIFVF
jgi:hypothetical protein